MTFNWMGRCLRYIDAPEPRSFATFSVLCYSKTLADLAIWEPKTFEAIARIARERAKTDDIWGTNELQIDNSVFISDPSAEKK